MNVKIKLINLTCADCATKINDYAKKNFHKANLNFTNSTLILEDDLDYPSFNKKLISLIDYIEALDSNIKVNNLTYDIIELKLEGLTCADCARKIDEEIQDQNGVVYTNLNFATSRYNVYVLKDSKIDILKIDKIINNIEEDVVVIDINNKINNEKSKIKTRIKLLRIISSSVLFALAYIFSNYSTMLFLLSYLIIGYDIILSGIKGKILDEKFLMTIATIAAIYIREFPEAVMVMLLFQIGESLQGLAVNKSRASISDLINIEPEYANLIVNNETMEINPSKIMINDLVLIKPGEKVPVDGIVIKGDSYIDTSNMTGESIPRKVVKGDHVVSGTINLDGAIEVKVTKEYKDSTVNKIIELLEESSDKDAELESIITRISKIYTPLVTIIALLLVFIPAILGSNIEPWIYKAAVFLVMSCPCALVISVPLSYFSGLGKASKEGVLIKGDIYLEKLANIDALLFDKTGTITKGNFNIIDHRYYAEEDGLKLAALIESYSNHPIAKSIVSNYDKNLDTSLVSNVRDYPGKGVVGEIDNNRILVGSKELLAMNNINVREDNLSDGTYVYVAKNNKHIASFVLADELKPGVVDDVNKLKELGVSNLAILSGDAEKSVVNIADQVGIKNYFSNLLPQDKVKITKEYKSKFKNVIFVGDGVNDAPVLREATVGISMGDLGADIAIESSDIVVMGEGLTGVINSIKIAKKTSRILKQNLILVAVVKIIVLLLGVLGYSSMWHAVFADTGISLIAILNSMRILRS